MTCPNRFEHIRDYAHRPGVLVGLGTCLTPEDAQRGIAAGASFVVSPVLDDAVVRETLRANCVSIPGCSTPSEYPGVILCLQCRRSHRRSKHDHTKTKS